MKIAIFGASGLGREVADICLEIGYSEIVFLVKNEAEKCIWPNKVYLDTIEKVEELKSDGFKFAIGIGDPKIRKLVAEKYPLLDYPNLIHPSATFGYGQRKEIENSIGNIITAGCNITNNTSFGDFVLVNLNVAVGHDCIIENFVSLMSSATVSGNVHIVKGGVKSGHMAA